MCYAEMLEAYPENPFHNFGHAVDVQAVIVSCSALAESIFKSSIETFIFLKRRKRCQNIEMSAEHMSEVKTMKLVEADSFLSN